MSEIEEELEKNDDNYVNLNKLAKSYNATPQRVFFSKKFLKKVVDVVSSHTLLKQRHMKIDDLIKAKKGRASVTWIHPELLNTSLKVLRRVASAKRSKNAAPPRSRRYQSTKKSSGNPPPPSPQSQSPEFRRTPIVQNEEEWKAHAEVLMAQRQALPKVALPSTSTRKEYPASNLQNIAELHNVKLPWRK